MDKLNILTWEKINFKETWPERESEGYIFKIDGTPVTNYIDWMQPVYVGDIYYSKFLESSKNFDEEYDPVLACCTCGCSECDSIRAYVTIKNDTVNWLIFNANGSFSREENLEERPYEDYEFDRIQYEATIKELMLQAEKEFLNRRK